MSQRRELILFISLFCFAVLILGRIETIDAGNSESALDHTKKNIEETAVVYYWGDVVAINAYLDRDCSIDEIKDISGHLKTHTYYRHNTKRYPVCIINYFMDKAKLQEKSDPWESKGWRYEYVINKQMKNEFLYSSVKGTTGSIK